MKRYFARLAVLLAALLPVVAQADESVIFNLATSQYKQDGIIQKSSPTFVDGKRGSFEVFKEQYWPTSTSFEINGTIPTGYYASGWVLSTATGGLGSKVKTWGATNSVNVVFDYKWAATYGTTLELTVSITQMVYSVKYDLNGGTISPKPPTGPWLYFDGGTLPAGDVAKCAGHTLTGWKVGDTSTILLPGASFTGSTLGVASNGQTVTLTAQWAVNQYDLALKVGEGIAKIYYMANGAKVYTPIMSDETVKVDYNTTWCAYATPAEGYTYTDTSATNPKTDTMKETGATFAPVARKSKCSVSVSTAGNGSASAFPSGSLDYGTSVTVTATPNTGYAFKKWESTVAPTEIYDNPYVFEIKQDVQFRANFTNIVCTVTFDAQGGTCSVTNRSVKYGSSIGPLPTPTYGGRYFRGWFDDPRHETHPITQGTIIQSDLTAYAHWGEAKQYTITAKANPVAGGGVTGGGKKYDAGTPATLTATNNPGYSFVDWAHGEKSPTFTTNVIADATYTANFTGNVYEVSFDPRPGKMDTEYRDVTFGKQYGNLPSPTPPQDKVFAGWYTNKTGGDKVTETTTVATAKDHTLYARYTDIVYTYYYVAFDGNGATNETPMAVQTIRRDKATALTPNVYAKPGSTFAGWATNGMDVVAYTNCATVLNLAEEDQTNTLKAVWAANVYTMHFEPNAATVLNPEAQSDIRDCKSGEGVRLPECAYVNLPSRGFIGWVDEKGVTSKALTVVTNYVSQSGTTLTNNAAWLDSGDLSEAVGLAGIAALTNQTGVGVWKVSSSGSRTGDECVTYPWGVGGGQMSMLVKDTGSLVFYYKKVVTAGNAKLDLCIDGETHKVVAYAESPEGYQYYAMAITNGGIHSISWDAKDSTSESSGAFYIDDASWMTNVTTYAVAFDANGGSGEMTPQEMTVGVPTALKPNGFTRKGWNFLGWATNATSTVAAYKDKSEVTNLAEPGKTNTLFAVWESADVGPLSKAVGLTNAVLENVPGYVAWTVVKEGYRSEPECIKCTIDGMGTSRLSMAVEGPGTVEYYVKGSLGHRYASSFTVRTNGVEYGDPVKLDKDNYIRKEIDVAPGVTNVTWQFQSQSSTFNQAYMDDVRWTPKGGEPKPVIFVIE